MRRELSRDTRVQMEADGEACPRAGSISGVAGGRELIVPLELKSTLSQGQPPSMQQPETVAIAIVADPDTDGSIEIGAFMLHIAWPCEPEKLGQRQNFVPLSASQRRDPRSSVWNGLR